MPGSKKQSPKPQTSTPTDFIAQPTPEPETFSSVKGRVLYGWLSDQEAVPMRLGQMPDPTEDINSTLIWIEQRRAEARGRTAFSSANPIIPNGISASDVARISTSPELQSRFAGIPWRIEAVDLTKILAYQKTIKFEDIDSRINPAKTKTKDLLELCIPTSDPPFPANQVFDPDGQGVALSSLNPNIRVAGLQINDMEFTPVPGLPPTTMKAVSVLIALQRSYLNVGKIGDRYVLRDGYHRAISLLSIGVKIVPAIVVEYTNYDELSERQPTLFTEVIIQSANPPLLTDFWDDNVSGEGFIPVARKVIHIRANQFPVPGQ